MLKSTFLSITFLIAINYCIAQTAEDSIKAVINKTFVAMKKGDTNMLKECFADGAILQSFVPKKGGLTVIKETVSDFCRNVASLPKGMVADEQVVFKQINIDGNMAAVWAPFKLYFNGKFYSCGVNSFQLVKLEKEWKIQYIIDTRRTKNCVE